VSSRLTLGGEVYGGIADTVGLYRTQLQTMLGAQYAVREGLSLYVGLIAGTYTASPRLAPELIESWRCRERCGEPLFGLVHRIRRSTTHQNRRFAKITDCELLQSERH
jgi:hypothetical protein